jgi:PPM family protein phosphatase
VSGIQSSSAATHTGHVRRSNEDSYLSSPPLFVVADGMGGARAGEVASRICVDTFRDMAGAVGMPAELLERVIGEANRRIHAKAIADPALGGMGTTVTAALLADDVVTIGHVGDSRAYRFRDGQLEQLTDDHSLVGELLRSGAINEAEAASHPQRAIITRVLGTEPTVQVDTVAAAARDGDVFMLCSDGLTTMVDDERIQAILAEPGQLPERCRALVQAANQAGGDDNVTVILFRIGDPPAVPDAAPAETPAVHSLLDLDDEPRRRSIGRRIVIGIAVLVIIAAATLAAGAFGRWAHFVGATPDGRVAVYQGVPVDLVGGVRLYRRVGLTPLPVSALTRSERDSLFDHTIGSSADTWRRIRELPAFAYFGGAQAT